MNVQLGAHWLAFLWSLVAGEGSKLETAVRLAKEAGASVFELMPPLLNQMSAEETANALKKGGITKAVMCHFYPEGALGDPLGEDKEWNKAVDAFSDVITYVEMLRTHGITIDLIVGPSCFVLAKDYGLSQDILKARMLKFYAQFTERLRGAKIRVAIELLREGEDKTIATVDNLANLLAELDDTIYGFHLDMFHLRDREYNIVRAIEMFGKRTFHVHANGTGRVPPGHELDDIEWPPIVAALKKEGYNGIATNEPFCQLVRDEAPELGEGLPDPMPEPEGLQMTAANLKKIGLLS